MRPPLDVDIALPDLILGVISARGVCSGPSPAPLRAEIDAAVASVRAAPEAPPPAVKKAVRDLLRTRGYRPSGRGKPASEYLVGAARRGALPAIDVLVDINNLVSLESWLPISVFDRDRFAGRPRVRFGAPGERYVFNASGQEIALEGLLLVADDETPRGSPVKDSVATRVGPETRRVMAVIYGARAVADAAVMEDHVRRFAHLLRTHAGADDVHTWIGPAPA